ncbi:MAG: hypothetical protein RR540_07365 [Oscillospiraceae bacterium]
MKKSVKSVAIFMIVLGILGFFAYSLIAFPKEFTNAIVRSINCCFTVIIPALYGFLVIGTFLVKTNIYAVLSKPFSVFSRYVFKIPEELFSVFLISQFAGFPIGAKLISELVSCGKIGKCDAEKIICYCYAGGPAFIIGLVGVELFGSVKIGLLIYLSIVLTNFVIGILFGIGKKVPVKSENKIEVKISWGILINSIESAAKSLFKVCFMIVFFAIITTILEQTGIIDFLAIGAAKFFSVTSENASGLVKSIFEISNLSSMSINCFKCLPFIAGIFSFGGVCIILQIFTLAGEKINLKKFVITRTFSTIICYFLSKIVFSIFIKEIPVYWSFDKVDFVMTASPIPSFCLIFMTIIILLKKSSNI